jgi:hypothetical protein
LDKARPSDVTYFWWRCTPPYDSTAHFTGKTKPWKREYDPNGDTDYSYRQTAARFLWFKELTELNEKYDVGLDMENWNKKHLPSMQGVALGGMAMFHDQKDVISSVLV